MNIFVLDEDLEKCAQYHVDKHVVKMITETAQLLCSAYYYTDDYEDVPYTLSHQNHPASIWVRDCIENWNWLLLLGLHLYREYKYRYGDKIHNGGEVLMWCHFNKPELPSKKFTSPPQCMPDIYKDINTVTAYRAYYLGEKRHIFKWTGREVPYWVE